jgi:glucose-1-phosphate adenylyltransferase
MRWEMNEFVELLPAQQRIDEESWYRGTADAVYQNIDIIRDHNSSYIVVLAGDHIYKQDYSRMLTAHVESGAQCTVACIEVPRLEARAFGVMAVDRSNQILEFVEKPAEPPAMPGKPDVALASMGLYVFNTSFLFKQLDEDMRNPASSHDFGKDIIPKIVKMKLAAAHPFSDSCVGAEGAEPYWRDVGTVDAYWAANIDLTTTTPALDMYDEDWPIWTYQEQLAPAKFVFDQDDRRGMAVDSIVSGGCIISGSRVANSVLFSRVRVHSFCEIDGAVLLPGVSVERHARLKNVVVDRGCRIREGMVIGEDPEADAKNFVRTEQGISLVTQERLDRLAQGNA